MQKIKIFFLLPSLHGGGAERVISILLNEIDKTRFDCYLLLLKKEGKFLEDIPEEVTIIDLKCDRVRSSIFKIVRLANRIRPDIIFTGIIHLSLLVIMFRFLFPKHSKFIARETTILSVHIKAMEKRPWLLKFLIRRFYPGFNTIVSQSTLMKSDLIENFNIPEKRITIISNPVDVNKIKNLAKVAQTEIDPSKYNILAVGRLSYEKGIDLLLEAFQHVRKKNDNAVLNILGIGEEEKFLKQLAINLSISDSVKFLGFFNNPYPIISKANVVVLSSRYDGFPNTVLESIACGTPVVAFNCPGGVNEIVIQDENGWLVKCGDISALSNALNYALRQKMNKEKVQKTLLPKFDSKYIVRKFETAFQLLVGHQG